MISDALVLILFPAAMAFAASSDLLTMTISNKISLLLVAGFFLLAPLIGLSTADVTTHVAAALMMLALAFVCFARGWIGGGDAKLASAIVLWLGFEHAIAFLLYASLFGGLITLAILKFRTLPIPAPFAGHGWAERLHRLDAGVPYGIALAAAALLVYPDTAFMKAVGL